MYYQSKVRKPVTSTRRERTKASEEKEMHRTIISVELLHFHNHYKCK